ncbi:MAG: hypothetical protein INR73_27950, partial [Williamsia sp.]|nr:hypothetical protein [Williamsia sp.]
MPPKDTLILTRRIRLLINSKDKDEIGAVYKQVYSWQRACRKAANTITTHLFVQEELSEMIYLHDGTRAKLADWHKDRDGILATSPQNTTYQVLSKEWKGAVPMHIMSSLNMWVTKQYRAGRDALLRGEQSLRSYGNALPVPFLSTDIKRLQPSEDGKGYTFQLFGLPFRTFFGGDGGEKKEVIEKAARGDIKWCTSHLQLKGNRIFMLAAFECPVERAPGLEEGIIAEASLSVECPISVTIGTHRYAIGNREEFLYGRLALQKARQRVQAAASFHRG